MNLIQFAIIIVIYTILPHSFSYETFIYYQSSFVFYYGVEKVYFLVNIKLSWNIAQEFCEGYQMNLASIETLTEQKIITDVVKKLKHETWIGGYNYQTDGLWRWVRNGNILNYTNWNAGEPNAAFGNTEHCAHMYITGEWNDLNCNETCIFICERDLK